MTHPNMNSPSVIEFLGVELLMRETQQNNVRARQVRQEARARGLKGQSSSKSRQESRGHADEAALQLQSRLGRLWQMLWEAPITDPPFGHCGGKGMIKCLV